MQSGLICASAVRILGSAAVFIACACGGDPDLQPGPQPTAAQRRAFSDGSYNLGAAVYEHLAEHRGNVIYSPSSAHLSLSLLAAGARGETRAELERALGGDLGGVHRAANAVLLSWLGSREHRTVLSAADRVFVDERARVVPRYQALIRDRYGARTLSVDFQHDAADVRAGIGEWAREATGVELAPPASAITSRTRLVVVSPIRFVGPWDEPFPARETRSEPFRRADGSIVSVPTMHVEGMFGLTETDDVQVVELPYKGGHFGLVLVRPRDGASLDSIGRPTAVRWREWRRGIDEGRRGVRLALPRFAVTSEPIDVAAPFREAGIRAVFDRDRADLGGLSDSGATLFVDSLVQRAAIEVDEEGTRAEAVTVETGMARTAQPPRSVEVRFDRPFLFILRDREFDVPVFVGRIEDPTAVEPR